MTNSDPKRIVKTCAIQAACRENQQENLTSTLDSIGRAADCGADLVCLQEMFNTIYLCQEESHEHFNLAEPIPGETTHALCEAAAKNEVVVVAGMFERRAPGVFHNSAIVIDCDGTIVGVYRKMHIPDDPHYFEKFYFTPGDAPQSDDDPAGFAAFETSLGKIGVCICWDQWFPEAARLTAMAGAEIIVYPTAIGYLRDEKDTYGPSQLAAWQTMLRSHAIANGVFVVAPNRVGIEANIEFWGNSLIVDPYGNLLAHGADRAETIAAEIDLTTIETARTHWPFFRDRRIDAYDGLLKRWGS